MLTNINNQNLFLSPDKQHSIYLERGENQSFRVQARSMFSFCPPPHTYYYKGWCNLPTPSLNDGTAFLQSLFIQYLALKRHPKIFFIVPIFQDHSISFSAGSSYNLGQVAMSTGVLRFKQWNLFETDVSRQDFFIIIIWNVHQFDVLILKNVESQI